MMRGLLLAFFDRRSSSLPDILNCAGYKEAMKVQRGFWIFAYIEPLFLEGMVTTYIYCIISKSDYHQGVEHSVPTDVISCLLFEVSRFKVIHINKPEVPYFTPL